jgi:hypothetical protein
MSEKKIMQRDVIVWDVDDTLCHFMAPALKALEKWNGRKITPDQCVNSMWLNDFLTKDELDQFLPTIFNPQFYTELKGTAILDNRWKDANFALLQQKYDFHAVTARRFALGQEALRVTSDWLHSQNVRMDGITICHPDQSKADAAPMNTKVIVDDSASVAIHGAYKGWTVFLVDRPWNKHLDVKTLPRVFRVTHENALTRMAEELLH